MPISIDWGNKVILVPQSYLTLITGTLYELDTDQFRLDLKGLEDDDEGMPFPDTHRHVTEVTIAGVTYARFIEIINGYSITFEDGQYSIRLSGSNNNFFDVENGILNQNQVQVIPGNSAGLIRVETGVSGLTQEESDQLMGTALEDGGRLQSIDGRLPSDPADQSAVEAAIIAAIPDMDDLALEASVQSRPTLAQIEASSVLAKQTELIRALGLMQENFKYEPLTHDTNGKPTSGKITIYSDNTLTTPIAIYNVIQSWNGDLLQSYAVSRAL